LIGNYWTLLHMHGADASCLILASDCVLSIWTFHSQCSGNDWKCSCSRITVIMQQLTWRICCNCEFCAL